MRGGVKPPTQKPRRLPLAHRRTTTPGVAGRRRGGFLAPFHASRGLRMGALFLLKSLEIFSLRQTSINLMRGVKLKQKIRAKTEVRFWGEILAPVKTFSPQL